MTLTIQGEMTNLNHYINMERSNKFAASAIKKRETQRVWDHCKEQKLETTPGRYPHLFIFTWYARNRRVDPDNLHFAAKFIFDGLVKASVLHCDGQECVGQVTHNTIKTDAKQPRVEVEIK